jgi:hypothetical protein
MLLDQTDGAINMFRSLGMKGNDVGAGLGEIRNDAISGPMVRLGT